MIRRPRDWNRVISIVMTLAAAAVAVPWLWHKYETRPKWWDPVQHYIIHVGLKETARMGQTESNLGIIPGFGGTQRMPRLIGRTKALEFMILGTQIPAAECLALGLVNRLSKEGETLNDARALARQISKRPPIATRLILEVVDDGLEAPIDQALEMETRAFIKTLRTEDAGEGIQAFFGKREPQFKGR